MSRNAIAMGGAALVDLSAENNLLFNYYPNDITPIPPTNVDNDLSGTSTYESVFASSADFSLNPAGAGIGTGRNVFGLVEYGDIRTDIEGKTRSATSAWDRGAYQYGP